MSWRCVNNVKIKKICIEKKLILLLLFQLDGIGYPSPTRYILYHRSAFRTLTSPISSYHFLFYLFSVFRVLFLHLFPSQIAILYSIIISIIYLLIKCLNYFILLSFIFATIDATLTYLFISYSIIITSLRCNYI